jgi:hypothetical protein
MPWIPAPGEMAQKIRDCLDLRTVNGYTTTFITPAAFAAMIVLIVRNFDNREYYSEEFT